MKVIRLVFIFVWIGIIFAVGIFGKLLRIK